MKACLLLDPVRVVDFSEIQRRDEMLESFHNPLLTSFFLIDYTCQGFPLRNEQ